MFANGGNDIINGVKQAAEFGLAKQGMKISAPLAQFPDVHGLGLKIAQGLLLASPFYYDMNPRGARLHRPLHQGDRPAAFLHPGRHLRRGDALPQGRAGGGHRRGQGGGGADEKLPINDFMTKTAACAPTAACCATCT